MENASKALLMAGGILIAILVIALVVQVFSSASSNYKAQEDKKTIEEITAFNKEFESYNKKLLRGADIITVCNKANNYNAKYVGEDGDIDKDGIRINIKAGLQINQKFMNTLIQDSEFKQKIFECTNVQYGENGRISRMTFQEYVKT